MIQVDNNFPVVTQPYIASIKAICVDCGLHRIRKQLIK